MSVRRWLAGVGLVAVAGAGIGLYAGASASAHDGAPAGPGAVTEQARRASPDPVLSGTRRVTIVRVGAFESGLSLLDGGRLAEVDDDRGRQVFVPTPLGGQQFLVKSYYGGGTGQPLCWRAHNPGNAQPLVVRGATCRADDPAQRFVITAAVGGGAREFVISNRSAYLRDSARSGLILEELGDADPFSSFRFNDTGPAPRP
ncbi:hypothetical protein AWW66_00130 [Micromonospora rosaria]|uniref:Ricin B lectin domain-containing protein n=1 Tax=Micromonospora rosaria TaxID=47874 RepID=A0A136PZM7_9ACTN|nr:hypothetical protein [Micromonospora rosaria]KXK63900.1 hypothetical protein AWW66_00130 [Micromonospora rosaria]